MWIIIFENIWDIHNERSEPCFKRDKCAVNTNLHTSIAKLRPSD